MRSTALILLALLALGGCSSSSTTPTEPAPRFAATVDITVRNSAGEETLRSVDLAVDDLVAVSFFVTAPEVTVTMRAQADPISAGPHQVRVTISDQTASPTSYEFVSGQVMVFDPEGNFLRRIALADQTFQVSTGGGATYTFTI